LLGERKFYFPMERILFATVLHRLVAPGSDRAAEKWINSYAEEVEVTHDNKQFIIRNEVSGIAGKALQAAGVTLPPVLRETNMRGTTPELRS
jgi:hypothetical protein